jgi:hypothetical protein
MRIAASILPPKVVISRMTAVRRSGVSPPLAYAIGQEARCGQRRSRRNRRCRVSRRGSRRGGELRAEVFELRNFASQEFLEDHA